VVDADGTVRFANAASVSMLGRRRDDLVGREVGFPVAAGEAMDLEIMGPERETIYADLRVVPTDWDGHPARLVLLRDVTARHRLEVQLARRATHDALTGLPNRVLLEDRLAQALARARRATHPVAVFFVDLDRFKAVNDTFGHATGDQVLVEAAHRIQASIRPGDTAARVGGDEFVLVCESMEPEVGEALVTRLKMAFDAPLAVDHAEIRLGLSVGWALADRADASPARLIAEADAAMYRAKRRRAEADPIPSRGR
jgi:diguanylate cyclase (GGDEF)-like protein